MKFRGLYLLVFQWSAGGSQAGAADLVQSLNYRTWGRAPAYDSRGILLSGTVGHGENVRTVFVKIIGKTALGRVFRGFSMRADGLEPAELSATAA